MSRQSISFTPPDDERLNAHVDWIRVKIEKAEYSGFTNDSKDQILKQSKSSIGG